MSTLKLPAFTVLSGVGWCIDFSIYNYLVALGQTYFVANLIGASVAVTFVLVTARQWIFRNHAAKLPTVVLKYLLWNIVAVTAASLLVQLVAGGLESLDFSSLAAAIRQLTGSAPQQVTIVSNLAKLLVTPITMYANFVMVGYIIERRFSFY